MSPEPNLTSLRVPEVWDRGDTGSGVVVATLDTGADVTHPELESRWRGGTNSWFDPYGQHPDRTGRPQWARDRHARRDRRRRRVRQRDRRGPGSHLDRRPRLRRPGRRDDDRGAPGVRVAAGPRPRPGDRRRPPGRERLLVARVGPGLRPDLPARRPGAHRRRHPAGLRRRELRLLIRVERQPGQLSRVPRRRRPRRAPARSSAPAAGVRRPAAGGPAPTRTWPLRGRTS